MMLPATQHKRAHPHHNLSHRRLVLYLPERDGRL